MRHGGRDHLHHLEELLHVERAVRVLVVLDEEVGEVALPERALDARRRAEAQAVAEASIFTLILLCK